MTRDNMTRRRWLLAGMAGALIPGAARGQVPGQRDSTVGELDYAWAAGRPREAITDWDNDPFIVELEERVKCNCGCAHSIYVCRTTDFNCGYWQALHAEIIDMVKAEMTADEIVEAYAAKYGTEFLMAPPPEGFNVMGYVLPGAVISLVGAVILWILARRHQMAPAMVEGHPATALDDLAPEDRERLEAALREIES